MYLWSIECVLWLHKWIVFVQMDYQRQSLHQLIVQEENNVLGTIWVLFELEFVLQSDGVHLLLESYLLYALTRLGCLALRPQMESLGLFVHVDY